MPAKTPTTHVHPWSPAKVTALIDFYRLGLSNTEIALKLGGELAGFNRCSVGSKLARLRSKRDPEFLKAGLRSRGKPGSLKRKPLPPEAKPAPSAEPGFPLEDLPARGCHFAITSHDPHRFCGQPVYTMETAAGEWRVMSYCLAHCLISYPRFRGRHLRLLPPPVAAPKPFVLGLRRKAA